MAKEKTDKKQNKTPNYVAMESALGAVCLLLTKAPSFKYLFAGEYEWRIIPAIATNQFALFRNDKKEPIAFVSFASINEEIEKRLLSGSLKLTPAEWKSGDKLYIIDVISPFAGVPEILKQLGENQFKDKKIHILKPSKDKKGGNIAITLKEFLSEINKNKSDKE